MMFITQWKTTHHTENRENYNVNEERQTTDVSIMTQMLKLFNKDLKVATTKIF